MGQVSFANAIEEIAALEQEHIYTPYNYNETTENKSWASALPIKQGLYDPALEKDACGVGFAA